MAEKKLSKRIGIIDCGSNTFHLGIYQIEKKGAFKIVFDENKPVGLGNKGYGKKRLDEDAIKRGLNALIEHKQICDLHGVNEIFATGTSAIRDAENGDYFRQIVKEKTGINIRTISGDEEAAYIFKGASVCIQNDPREALLIDIGGGSCEFIHHKGNKMLEKFSFNIGVSRIKEMFTPQDILSSENIQNISNFISSQISPLKDYLKGIKIEVLTGTSGTFDTFTAMVLENQLPHFANDLHTEYDLQTFEQLKQMVLPVSLQQRLKVKGLIPFRAGLIHLSVLIIQEVISSFQITQIKALKYNLKEGVLLEILNSDKKS